MSTTSYLSEDQIPSTFDSHIATDGIHRILRNCCIQTKHKGQLVSLENFSCYALRNPIVATGELTETKEEDEMKLEENGIIKKEESSTPKNTIKEENTKMNDNEVQPTTVNTLTNGQLETSTSQQSQKKTEPKKIKIQTEDIVLWSLEYSEEPVKIWVKTESGVWYQIADPSPEYKSLFNELYEKAELSDKVLRMLSDNPELTITELGLSGEVDLELVLQHSEFITHHIKGLGDQKINASPFFRDLVKATRKYIQLKAGKKLKLTAREKLLERNKSIKEETQSSKEETLKYFAKHWHKIEPFVSEHTNMRDKTKSVIYKIQQIREQMEKSGELTKEEPEKPLMKQPDFIKNGTMRAYQLKGLQWMLSLYDNKVTGAILGDEMGLGKTLQTIALLGCVHFLRKAKGPYLIIAPLSVLPSWMNEFQRWCPRFRVLKYHGNHVERDVLRAKMHQGNFDVCVTNYESVKSDFNVLHKFAWEYVVLDEAHRIKNENAIISKKIFKLRRHYSLLLTGTPLQNNLHELWALLYFMYPDIFWSSSKFDACFDLVKKTVDREKLAKVHLLLEPFMIRRVKNEVELDLPKKKETKLFVPLSAMQTKWYKNVLTQTPIFENGKQVDVKKLMMLLMQLRKVCCHPFLFSQAEEVDSDGEFVTDERIITSSGKMVLLDKMLPKLKAAGSRVLIYSQFTTMLDILEDYCRYKGFKYVRLDGSTHQIERESNVDRFNHKSSDIFIFLLSTRAGGLGLNLHTADTVILYDSDWNPQQDLQAQARAHRIGQTKPVNVYRLICQGTVEERIITRAEQKMFLDAMVIKAGQKIATDTLGGKEELDSKDLLSILSFGAEAIFKSDGVDITEEDIDILLNKSKQYNDKRLKEFEKGEYSVRDFQILKEKSIYEFSGENLEEERKKRKKKMDREKWLSSGKREKQERVAIVRGLPVLKEQLKTPTITIVRKKKGRKYKLESECFICHKDEGPFITCNLCPKVYHKTCVGVTGRPQSWRCPWHTCSVCKKTNTQVGGMMYRCENCVNSYCKRCAPDISTFTFLGRSIKYESAGYKCNAAIYIHCPDCRKSEMNGETAYDVSPSNKRKLETEMNGVAKKQKIES